MDVESVEELRSEVTRNMNDKQNSQDESKPCSIAHPKKGLGVRISRML